MLFSQVFNDWTVSHTLLEMQGGQGGAFGSDEYCLQKKKNPP